MSRKKYNPRTIDAYIGEQSPFAERLSQLINDRGLKQREVGEFINVQRQTVSLYTKGQALPDIACLTKLTELFNVSADYLLGITDAPTADVKKRAVCDYIGLSESAVDVLREMKRDKSKYSQSKILSDIIIDNRFADFIERVQQFITERIEHHTYHYSDKAIMDFCMTSDGSSEAEAKDYAASVNKRLISPGDLAHLYRKLSVELLERILLDLSDEYTAEEVGFPADVPGELIDD
jgi:transcriptional regulator with XRE-family HTH domain